MLNPESFYKEKIKESLLKIDRSVIKELGYKKIEIFEDEKLEKLENLFFISELKFELLKGKTLQDVLINSPYMGVLIYQDKYVYSNPYMCKLLGYTSEEFCKLKPEEIIYFEKDREKVRKVVERRLRGEYFIQTYEDIVFKKLRITKKFMPLSFLKPSFMKGN